MTTDERRAWVRDEAEDAGLNPAQVELAVSAAMSASDDVDDETFEDMVASIIEGAADTDEDILIPVSALVECSCPLVWSGHGEPKPDPKRVDAECPRHGRKD